MRKLVIIATDSDMADIAYEASEAMGCMDGLEKLRLLEHAAKNTTGDVTFVNFSSGRVYKLEDVEEAADKYVRTMEGSTTQT